MNDHEIEVAGISTAPPAGWSAAWLDRVAGIVRLSDGIRSVIAVVEGRGTEWWVTLYGRRMSVTVRSWRERMLAEAEVAVGAAGGPLEVRATLPGLVVAVAVRDGDEVGEGDPLLTIEAMKMQNEVRATRGGRVASVAVAAGQAVATGALLLRLE